MHNYASLEDGEPENPRIQFHVTEQSRSKWNHIKDLDAFFTRMYKYHQRHGFYTMLLDEICNLFNFSFLIIFGLILWRFINYTILFNMVNSNTGKYKFWEIFFPVGEWLNRMNWLIWILLIIAIGVFVWRLILAVNNLTRSWEMKQFFNEKLLIADHDIENITWHDVQQKVRAVQVKEEMCIYKKELTELDIYHRILRRENYLIALVNKRIIPPRLKTPFFGEYLYWSNYLQFMLEFLLFRGPWAVFDDPGQLKEEYKKQCNRTQLAKRMEDIVRSLAITSFCLSPLIGLYHLISFFFKYTDLIRRDPGILTFRTWSPYARLYLRHFNELEHEFNMRLGRAHRPATKYLSSFYSPIVISIAKSCQLIASAMCGAILIFTIYDEDAMFNVEHMITVAAVLGVVVVVSTSLIPNNSTSFNREALLHDVMTHISYLPAGWKGNAHTRRIRMEFSELFNYKFAALLEAMFASILTPWILYRYIKPRSLDIVDFFRNFTVSIDGVGDVCSFAQMDIRKHGDPKMHETQSALPKDQYTQAEDGKTEMSLIHFNFTNPYWVPPPESRAFVESVTREKPLVMAASTSSQLDGDHQHYGSSLLSPSNQYGSIDNSLSGWNTEGPGTTLPDDLQASTAVLLRRHFRNLEQMQLSTMANINIENVQGSRPAVETTPLLLDQQH